MRTRLLFTLIVAVGCVQHATAQNQASNLQKYWTYRDRLREKFVVVDQNVGRRGVNIPASYIDHGNNTVNWGDSNNGMSHYLSLLATELWILKANGQNYKETLKELYYAMIAMERLDLYSEYSLREKHNVGMPNPGGPTFPNVPYTDPYNDVNGFHIRDDVSEEFWATYQSHFTVPDFTSVYRGNPGEPDRIRQEMSQDNIYHNFEGLALVANLIGTESVADIPVTWNSENNSVTVETILTREGIKNGNMINFQLWAQDYVKRYIRFMQSRSITYEVHVAGYGLASATNHWILVNPITNEFVLEGSGEDFDLGVFYNAGVIAAGQSITGQNLRTESAFIISNGQSEGIFNTLFRIGPTDEHIVIDWPAPINLVVDPIEFDIQFDDYKVRTLATIGKTKGIETFNILRSSRDNATPLNYEHMPLLYTVLHDPSNFQFAPGSGKYIADRTMLESLFNVAPASGPTGAASYAWSTESRLVWPERNGQWASQNVEFSGMDYMVLHNLYYIALRGEDLRGLIIPSGSSEFASGEARGKTIIAANTINGTTAQYIARQSVRLDPGFKAAEGSTFTAKIGQRAGEYDAQLYIDPTPTNGRIASKNYPDVGKAAYNVAQHTAPPTEKNIKIILTKTNETLKSKQFAIYPNPSSNKINIELGEHGGSITTATLLRSDGTVVRTLTFEGVTASIDVSALPAGIYLLRVTTNGRTVTEKISVVH